MSKPNHRLATKRERLDEALKKVSFVCKDALDEAAAAGDAVSAAKIVKIKNEIIRSVKELRPLIQEEPGDTEEKQNLFLM